MIKIIPKRNIWFTVSGVLVILSVVIIASMGLPLGIDFTGGSLLEIQVSGEIPDLESVNKALEGVNDEVGSIKVQQAGLDSFILRSASLNEDQHKVVIESVSRLLTEESNLIELRFESIGPSLGKELKDKAVMALIMTAIGIILFVAWSFRHVSNPDKSGGISGPSSWKYGISAIIALIHDVLITVGVFTIIARIFDFQMDALFVTALLVTLGYSVNDTIVVFDRTRERLQLNKGKIKLEFAELVNISVNSTIARSINTSVTTLLVLIALLVLSGSSIVGFITTLIIGVLIGTYSSIFLASPLLVLWAKKGKK